METLLKVFGAAFGIVGLIALVTAIPDRFLHAGAALFAGLLLLALGELLSRIGRKQ